MTVDNLQKIHTVEGLKQELQRLRDNANAEKVPIDAENIGAVEKEENKRFIREFVAGTSCIHGVGTAMRLGECKGWSWYRDETW